MNEIKILENLKERNLQLDRYISPAIDEQDNVLTLLSWTLSGNLSGYMQYRPNESKEKKNVEGRGRYYVRVGQGHDAVWGLETYHYSNSIFCITEGLFDAVPLHNRNIGTAALFTSNPKPMRPWLYTIPKMIVAIRDNDDACKLQNYSDFSITPISKDLGDASNDEVDEIVGRILELNEQWI